MTPELALRLAVDPALTLLPERMSSRPARSMLIAIGLQESRFEFRQQVLRPGRAWWEWRGPARGWWQFETSGLRGTLTHRASQGHAQALMATLGYSSPPSFLPTWLSSLHEALKHQDVLAAGMARLLLWTLPRALPTNAEGGLAQYLDAWRPGAWARGNAAQRKELADKWNRNWAIAQEVVA